MADLGIKLAFPTLDQKISVSGQHFVVSLEIAGLS